MQVTGTIIELGTSLTSGIEPVVTNGLGSLLTIFATIVPYLVAFLLTLYVAPLLASCIWSFAKGYYNSDMFGDGARNKSYEERQKEIRSSSLSSERELRDKVDQRVAMYNKKFNS